MLLAGWLAKCGCLVSTLELKMLPKPSKYALSSRLSERTAAEQAIATALQAASAAGAATDSGASGLIMRSCKLSNVGLGSAAILQALPGSTLTSLEFNINLADATPANAVRALSAELGTALQRLQQLQMLSLSSCGSNERDLGFDLPLRGFGDLTNLTAWSRRW
jgi:hypothetical protein